MLGLTKNKTKIKPGAWALLFYLLSGVPEKQYPPETLILARSSYSPSQHHASECPVGELTCTAGFMVLFSRQKNFEFLTFAGLWSKNAGESWFIPESAVGRVRSRASWLLSCPCRTHAHLDAQGLLQRSPRAALSAPFSGWPAELTWPVTTS